MLFFRRKPAPVEPAPEEVVEAPPELPEEPWLRKYEGDVVFASDGVHYPILFVDGVEQGPDYSQPLRFNADGNGWFFFHARPEDPTHFHKYHQGHVDITPEA